MKNNLIISTILTTGRTGSDYLQGCLDGVPGVITLTGKTFFKDFFEKLELKKIDLSKQKEVIDEFIKLNSNLFDSDYIEQKIDKNIFKINLLNELKNKSLNKKNFILSIFFAYEKTTRNKTDDVKVIVNHSHSVKETKFFLGLFPECKLLITIRDPLSNLMSGLKHWKIFKKDIEGQRHNYRYIRRVISDLRFAEKLFVNKYFVKLEESFEITKKKELCDFLKIEYSEEINFATYNNKFWIGDKLSQNRTYDGSFNKKVLNRPLKDYFSSRDIFCLRYFYKEYYKKYYHHKKNNFFYDKIKFYILSIFPLSFEIKEIMKSPTNVSNYIFYFKRVILFFFLKNNS